ncbi:hypothetical protein C8039_19425 [Halogeometricum sp. wsp3]|nr:hypothetical protein C8039_19425 [Halogeometricum sp. wsp3]
MDDENSRKPGDQHKSALTNQPAGRIGAALGVVLSRTIDHEVRSPRQTLPRARSDKRRSVRDLRTRYVYRRTSLPARTVRTLCSPRRVTRRFVGQFERSLVSRSADGWLRIEQRDAREKLRQLQERLELRCRERTPESRSRTWRRTR